MGSPADVAPFSAYFPLATRYSLDVPALFNEFGLDKIWTESYNDVKNVTWLSSGSWDPCNFITKDPIRSLADIKGKKLYTFPTAGRFLSRFGIVPVTIPVEDIEMALRTGELDGVVWCGITEAYTVGWANATKYFLTNNISGAWIGSFLANTKSWEKVPPHLQELFRLCMDSSHYYRQYWYWAGEANLRVNGGKLKLTTIPAEEWKSIEDGALKFWDEVVAKGEGEHGCAYDEAHPPLHTLCRQTQRIRRRGRDVSAFGDNGDVAVFDIYKCDTPSGDMGYGNVAVYDGCVLHFGRREQSQTRNTRAYGLCLRTLEGAHKGNG